MRGDLGALLAHVRQLPEPVFISTLPEAAWPRARRALELAGADFAAVLAGGEAGLVSTAEPELGRTAAWEPGVGADAVRAFAHGVGRAQLVLSERWAALAHGGPPPG
jgi:hypothetical protein